MTKITFVMPSGEEKLVDAPNGISLLEVAHKNGVPLEGACEGSLACSTCHLIVSEDFYDRLPPASDDEEDMLDLAFGLTHTSRLGCQIMVNDSLEGLKVAVPSATRNMMVDKKTGS
ncbi:MAG: ferredoxin family 2Fe-2S iron-sulfur cluster binding protein [Alphaproteobacteria bacterium]